MLLTVDLERLDVRAGLLLLDAGCGEGRHCFGALERGARVERVFQWKQAAAGLCEVFEETLRAAHRRPRAA